VRCTVSRYWVAQILRITRNRWHERKQLFVAKYTQVIVLCCVASQWLRYRVLTNLICDICNVNFSPSKQMFLHNLVCTDCTTVSQRKGHPEQHSYTFVICVSPQFQYSLAAAALWNELSRFSVRMVGQYQEVRGYKEMSSILGDQ
jgi:hypothetical protein